MAIINPVNYFANPVGGSPFPQTITDPNAPADMIPTAVVVLISGHKQSLGGLGTVPKSRGRMSVGMANFTSAGAVSNQMAIAGSRKDAQAAATAISDWRSDNAKVISLPSSVGAGALEMDFTLSGASAGAISGNWSSASDFYGVVFFIYGSLVEASVEVLTNSATVGNTVSSTLLGKPPDLLIAASCGQTIGAANGGTQFLISIGALAKAGTQFAVSCAIEHNRNPTSAGNLIRNDAILSQLTSTLGVVTEGARLEAALTATGFDITSRHPTIANGLPGPQIDGLYIALYLGGAAVRTWSGVEDIAAGTTGSKSITSPGWKPRTVFAAAAVITTGNVNVVSSANGRISFGGASLIGGSIVQGVNGLWDRDNQATSESTSIASDVDLISLPASTATFDWIAAVTDMTATGFDINVSDAAAANRLAGFVAIEGQYDRPYLIPPAQRVRWPGRRM